MQINPINQIQGCITVPGDKSISHRAIMISSLAKGISTIHNFLPGDDCISTINCFRALGITIEMEESTVTVHGKGIHGLSKSDTTLDVGNSGTTLRLLSGILSAQPFNTTITGDMSIQKRPMKRIMEPLSLMGAIINSLNNNNCAPLLIKGTKLNGINYTLPIASAQVKSSIMLASLYANNKTTIIEPYTSRNHTEIMLEYYGAEVLTEKNMITIMPNQILEAKEINVPGDISSAAYFITACLILPNSKLTIKNVGINNTRTGIIDVYKRMGANIQLTNICTKNGELVADIVVASSNLNGTIIEGSLIPRLIDEIPIIAVAAAFANGTTIVKDASELKVKESNRIDTMVNNLKLMGVNINSTTDGMIINGGNSLQGSRVNSFDDHRVAMSLAIAGLRANGKTFIDNSNCVSISYPTFFDTLKKLS